MAGQLIHHSDRSVQYVSIKSTERLDKAEIEPSVVCIGASYDNALGETVIGLFKTEVIHRRGPWRTLDAVEFATLEWVDWFMYGCPRSRKDNLTVPARDRVRSCIRPRVAAIVMPRAGMEMRGPSANQQTRAQGS